VLEEDYEDEVRYERIKSLKRIWSLNECMSETV
jgi:hypothetical protein